MKVKEIMSHELQGVHAESSLQDAAERMRALDVGSLPVVSADRNRVVGMVTDRDIVVRGVSRGEDVKKQAVSSVMTRNLVCVRAEDELVDASKAMKAKQVRRVLVLNNRDQPVGILSVGDLASAGMDESELSSLMRYVATPGQAEA
jgi:CBS domain-containing protein